MALSFRYDDRQDDAPNMEILRRMRDLFVTEVRTSLLSGIFQENPDDLEVYGEIATKEVTVVVVDSRKHKRFSQNVAFGEFSRAEESEGAPKDTREGTPAKEDEVPQGDLKAPSSQDILEEHLRMPKLTLHKRVDEDEFLNKRRSGELLDTVSSKVKGMAAKFVTEYLAAKNSEI